MIKLKNFTLAFLSFLIFIGCPTDPDSDEEKLQHYYSGDWEFSKSIYSGSSNFELKNYFISLNNDGTFESNFSFYWTIDSLTGMNNMNGTWEVKKKYVYWGDWYPLLIVSHSNSKKFWRLSLKGNNLFWLKHNEDIDSLITWVSK